MHLPHTALQWIGAAVVVPWALLMLVTIVSSIVAGVLSKQWPACAVWCLLWLAHGTLSYIGAILGVPIVGWLAYREAWTIGINPLGKPIELWKPAWAYPWGNLEDGVIPPSFVSGAPYLAGCSDRWRAFVWCAWRNKISNLRFTRPLGFTIDPKRVAYVGNDGNLYETLPYDSRPLLWSLACQGPYAGLWIVWRGHIQFRIGWTIVPADAKGFDPTNLRQLWCGYSLQFNKGA